MSFWGTFFDRFSKKSNTVTVRKSDVKFSSLIRNIQADMIDANQSFNCIGVKYIEQFFEKSPVSLEPEDIASVNSKLDAIEKDLELGDVGQAKKAIAILKDDVSAMCQSTGKGSSHYRPKMADFDMPTVQQGIIKNQPVSVPLLTLTNLSAPCVKEVTFTSAVQVISKQDGEVYVRLVDGDIVDKKKNIAELKVLISAEHNDDDIDEIIRNNEQIFESYLT